MAAALTLACGCIEAEGAPEPEPQVASTAQALSMEDEIDKKWQSLGGAAVMGQPTTAHQPLGIYGKFRRYANGTIVYSLPYGAVSMPHAIFDR
jgi:hypothetical protein